MFAIAKARISQDILENIDPEVMATKFVYVERFCGVKIEKSDNTFSLTGSWEAIKEAHTLLKKLFLNQHDGEVDFSRYRDKNPPEPKEKFIKIKSNLKRGRKKPPGIIPEPEVFIQYKDKGFKNPQEINLKEVLAEFHKTQNGQTVRKEELLKVLQKGQCLPIQQNDAILTVSQNKSNEDIVDDIETGLQANESSPEHEVPGMRTIEAQTGTSHENTERTTLADTNTTENDQSSKESNASVVASSISDLTNKSAESQSDALTLPPVLVVDAERTESNKQVFSSECEAIQTDTDISKDGTVVESIGVDASFSDETKEEDNKLLSKTKKPDKRKQGKKKKSSRATVQKVKSLRNEEKVTKHMRGTERTTSKKKENLSDITQEIKEKCKVKKPKPQSKQSTDDVDINNKSVNKIDSNTDAKSVPNIYKCSKCEYKSPRKFRLTEHMGRVHGLLSLNCKSAQIKDVFHCAMCEKTFVFGKDLNRHKKMVHANERFTCTVCEKQYKSKYVFSKHVKSHSDDYKRNMFPCQLCDREFTTKFSLSNHIKSQHLDMKKTFSCPTCGKTFSGRRSYLQHANAHLGVKPYACEICGKTFTYDKSLTEHRYLHDSVRRFKCSHCGKAFRQKTCLLIHERVHNKKHNQVCLYCGQTFTQRQSLLRHERIHTGEKPYKCNLCSKSFNDGAVVRKHLLMVHNRDKDASKHCVVREKREPANYYVSGGPGYQPRESAEQVRMRNRATVIPPHISGRPTVVAPEITDASSSTKGEGDANIRDSGISAMQDIGLQESIDNRPDVSPGMISEIDNECKTSAAYSLQDSSTATTEPERKEHSSFVQCLGPSMSAIPVQSASESADLNSINGNSQMVQNYLSNLPNQDMFTGFEFQTIQDESLFLKPNTPLVQSSQSMYQPHFNSLSTVNSGPGLTNGVNMEAMSSESLNYQLYPLTSHVAMTTESKVTPAANPWGYPGYSDQYYYSGQYEPPNL